MNSRVYNFSPGPAVLPLPVLEEIQRNLLALPGAGASILEISHRSPAFLEILDRATTNLRQLLKISENYSILWMQGGSRLQFSMVPMNLLRGTGRVADFLLTGSWTAKAFTEARREGDVRIAWDGKATGFDHVPQPADLELDDQAAYVYFTSNETIQGVQFKDPPETEDVPLVCDASSDLLSRPITITNYDLIFACAQKNAGPAGVTIVIIHKDLLERSSDNLPGYLNYKAHDNNDSLYNTPPTFSIYVAGLVVRWLLDNVGGLKQMERLNMEKAVMIYDAIDRSEGFYCGHARTESRSLMNVTFRLANDNLHTRFLEQAKERKLHGLNGHRSVGGIRASIYNAMPTEGVVTLKDFMDEFRERNH